MSARTSSEYPSIKALLNQPTGHASMARNMDPYEFYFREESPVQSELEPGPRLDYNIIYAWAVRLAPAIKDRAKRRKFLDAFEDVADARSNYHRCCVEYQKARNELQHVSLFHEIMTERKEELEKHIAQWQGKKGMEIILKKNEKELETIKWQIKMNDISGPTTLTNAQTVARIKAQVSMHFVDMKSSLIKNYLPHMATLETHYWAAMQHRAATTRMAKGPQPTVQSNIEKQALRRYHQATNGEVVKRMKPSPELARAIEQARIAVGQSSAGPPKSTS